MRRIAKIQLAATASLAALALAACREDEVQTRTAMEPAPLDYGYGYAESLPAAAPARVSYYEPERGYEWAERAYDLQRAYYDVPPDYAFDYGDYDPWVWETADDGFMYAEPWGDDGYLYSYFEPGAAYPYFIRDQRYGYGFDAMGTLVSLIDASGAYLPVERYYEVAPLAGRYFVHARDMRRASAKAPKIKIVQATWEQRAPRLRDGGAVWVKAAQTDDTWKAWRAKKGDRPAKELRVARHETPVALEARHQGRDAAAKAPKEWRGRDKHEDRSARLDHKPARAADDHGRATGFDDRGRDAKGPGSTMKPEHGRGHGGDKAKSDDHGGHGKGHGGEGPKGQGQKDHGGGKGGGKKE